MKLLFVVCCVIAVIGIALFVGCSSENDTDTCMSCHSETTTEGKQILGAQAGYDNSGHWNGPRMLVPMQVLNATGHLYVFHGSNAAYANAESRGEACHKCHTHEGFVEYAETGANATATDMTPAPPGCFSCHAPHEQGNFGLRTTAAVVLADGTTFDEGDGNLCATCHLARRDASTGIDPTDFEDKLVGGWPDGNTDYISSHYGPHHGPQADYLMGANNAIGGTNAESPHASGDSCVTCHHFQPDEGLSGNLEWGGHGFYLTSEVHGASKDLLDACTSCHTEDFTEDDPESVYDTPEAFLYMNVSAQDWDGDGDATEWLFEEIQGMRDTLIDYFGTGTNFLTRTPNVWDPIEEEWTYNYALGGAGDGALIDANPVDPAVPEDVDSGTWGYEWGQSWVFSEAEMSQEQAEALWNFKLFIEDKSMGVHNSVYAVQLLYDAITRLNGMTSAPNLDLGGSRPN